MRWALFLIVSFMAGPAAAQGVPACGPPRSGQLACVANRLCACRFERGGALAGQPDRWAWDCGILRPDCAAPPAGEPPPGLEGADVLVMPPAPRPPPR